MKRPMLLSQLLLASAALFLSGCSKEPTPASGSAKSSSSGSEAAPEFPDSPIVEIVTSEGMIKAELFKSKSPKTVDNFLKYAEKKQFDNTVFHRVMKGFMIQGGGFGKLDGKLEEKETLPPIPNEAGNGLKNKRGTLAMARTNDPHSATAQFFINTVDNNKLNLGDPSAVSPDGYAVFGQVLAGMDVVDRIEQTQTGTRELISRGPGGQLSASGHPDVPMKDIVIQEVRVIKK
jgi:cyclophilin family peptidyl-prolyl cis-trans isomerase